MVFDAADYTAKNGNSTSQLNVMGLETEHLSVHCGGENRMGQYGGNQINMFNATTGTYFFSHLTR